MRQRCRCSAKHLRARTTHRGTHQRNRAAFTLVELIVAMLILTVGLLAMAGTAGIVTRQMGAGARQSVAAQVAESRLEWLRATACHSIGDSTTTTRGVTEKWKHTVSGKSIVILDSVKYTSAPGHTVAQAFTTSLTCI